MAVLAGRWYKVSPGCGETTLNARTALLPFIFAAALLSLRSYGASAGLQDYAEALRSKPNLEHGEELFHQCAVCHGKAGGGDENADIPRLAGQHFNVLIRQLVDYRHNMRWDIRMEHYAGRKLLPDSQSIADVAGYISQLSRVGPRNVGDGQLVQMGARLYGERCAACHGKAGEGDNTEVVPRIAGQHYTYLLRQMHDAVDGRRPNFSLQHVRLLAKLDRDDLQAVADFLSRSDWTGPQDQLALAR